MDAYNGVLYQNDVKELERGFIYFYAKWELGTCSFAAGPQTPMHSDSTVRTTRSTESSFCAFMSPFLKYFSLRLLK